MLQEDFERIIAQSLAGLPDGDSCVMQRVTCGMSAVQLVAFYAKLAQDKKSVLPDVLPAAKVAEPVVGQVVPTQTGQWKERRFVQIGGSVRVVTSQWKNKTETADRQNIQEQMREVVSFSDGTV
jgi:hypothetical protein